MIFQLLPVLDTMLSFYEKPLNSTRFQAYLQLLQGDTKSDLVFPIGGFNPMAKTHILLIINYLKKLLILKKLMIFIKKISTVTTITLSLISYMAMPLPRKWLFQLTGLNPNKRRFLIQYIDNQYIKVNYNCFC